MNHICALNGVCATPRPLVYIAPRLICASTNPCSAAIFHQPTAFLGNFVPPHYLFVPSRAEIVLRLSQSLLCCQRKAATLCKPCNTSSSSVHLSEIKLRIDALFCRQRPPTHNSRIIPGHTSLLFVHQLRLNCAPILPLVPTTSTSARPVCSSVQHPDLFVHQAKINCAAVSPTSLQPLVQRWQRSTPLFFAVSPQIAASLAFAETAIVSSAAITNTVVFAVRTMFFTPTPSSPSCCQLTIETSNINTDVPICSVSVCMFALCQQFLRGVGVF